MTRTRRSFQAWALLAALACPHVVGSGLLLHVLSHDHQPESVRVVPDDLEAALHGHTHLEGTPAHGHPLLGTSTAPLASRAAPLPDPVAGKTPWLVLPDASRAQALAGHAPRYDRPPRTAAPLILRI